MAEPSRINPFALPSQANVYDAWYETPLGAAMDRLQKNLVFAMARPKAGELALDVGCGTGNYACELAKRGLRVVGCDPSEAMLAVARQKPWPVAWEQACAEHLPYADDRFDLVLSVTVLEFVQDPVRALAEMYRVTAPGGRLVVGVLNAQSAWGRRYAAQATQPDSPFAHAHLYTPQEFTTLLGRLGPVRWNSAGFVPPSGHGLRWATLLDWWGRALRRGYGALLVGRVEK